MDAVQLTLLGRTLMGLGVQAMPQSGFSRLPPSVRLVLVDAFSNPGSSIREITERTGLPQSLVSEAVGRLKNAGALITGQDPGDRRRTLVRPAPEVWARLPDIPSNSIETVLAEALESDDPADVTEVIAALEFLMRRLAPAAYARFQAGPDAEPRSAADPGEGR
jgi:DNA-binding MarR family transcriptional regulator